VLLGIGMLVFSLLVLVQGGVNLWLTIWIWQEPERLEATGSPDHRAAPRHGFTVLLPARDEVAVIGETLRRLSEMDYPQELFELLVICHDSDAATVDAARAAIAVNGIGNARVLTFHESPINKPRGLNVGLLQAEHDITTVFDAEDDVHPELFAILNTIFVEDEPDVVQAGVQLMDYRSHWWSVHNVLEYYFWFKSRMHAHARAGVVPLGGNTVFFRTSQLLAVGGWSEDCLTEDGEIGIRLSSDGAVIHATYDPRHVTREETPPTVRSFVKQRTRWNQGFLQIARSGVWRELPTRRQRALCLYLLTFPLAQAALTLLTPVLLTVGFLTSLPVAISLLSYVPLMLVGLQLLILEAGLVLFCREQHQPLRVRTMLGLLVSFLPYQVLLGWGAARAVVRTVRSQEAWEKTEHTGQHRPATAVLPDDAVYPVAPQQRAELTTSGELR
jgi:cellulose synthase/poly-beta-1,6-N-acetylglucosamine synthase-like glycosyltransferase